MCSSVSKSSFVSIKIHRFIHHHFAAHNALVTSIIYAFISSSFSCSLECSGPLLPQACLPLLARKRHGETLTLWTSQQSRFHTLNHCDERAQSVLLADKYSLQHHDLLGDWRSGQLTFLLCSDSELKSQSQIFVFNRQKKFLVTLVRSSAIFCTNVTV